MSKLCNNHWTGFHWFYFCNILNIYYCRIQWKTLSLKLKKQVDFRRHFKRVSFLRKEAVSHRVESFDLKKIEHLCLCSLVAGLPHQSTSCTLASVVVVCPAVLMTGVSEQPALSCSNFFTSSAMKWTWWPMWNSNLFYIAGFMWECMVEKRLVFTLQRKTGKRLQKKILVPVISSISDLWYYVNLHYFFTAKSDLGYWDDEGLPNLLYQPLLSATILSLFWTYCFGIKHQTASCKIKL